MAWDAVQVPEPMVEYIDPDFILLDSAEPAECSELQCFKLMVFHLDSCTPGLSSANPDTSMTLL